MKHQELGLLLVTASIVCASPFARAATPCRDVLDFESVSCRAAELATRTRALSGQLERVMDKLEQRFDLAAAACDSGDTRRARRMLRSTRGRLRHVQRRLDRAVLREDLQAAEAHDLVGLVRLLDALRRSVYGRLGRHPCPEYLQILSPLAGELARDGAVHLLVELSPEADPATTEARLNGIPLAFESRSDAQGWARVVCPASGTHRLEVSVRGLATGRLDREEITFQCGETGLTLAGEVDVLIDHDHRPSVLRLSPVRPLRSGATYAAVVTSPVRFRGAARAIPSAAFRTAAGITGRVRRGAVALYSSDPNDPTNPFPSERLLLPDGTIRIPEGFSARAVDPAARLDGVRAFLADLDRRSEEHAGRPAVVSGRGLRPFRDPRGGIARRILRQEIEGFPPAGVGRQFIKRNELNSGSVPLISSFAWKELTRLDLRASAAD